MVNRIQFESIDGRSNAVSSQSRAAPAQQSFSAVLESEAQSLRAVKFSAHAQRRLDERGITLTEADQGRITQAVDSAAEKGARETLLLMENCALVVSVPNRTVITAVDQNEMEDQVFTNIDSAIIIASKDEAAPSQAENGLDPAWGSLGVAERLTRRY